MLVIVNESFWRQPSPDIQMQIERSDEETTVWNMEESIKMNETQLQEIKKHRDLNIYELPTEAKDDGSNVSSHFIRRLKRNWP